MSFDYRNRNYKNTVAGAAKTRTEQKLHGEPAIYKRAARRGATYKASGGEDRGVAKKGEGGA